MYGEECCMRSNKVVTIVLNSRPITKKAVHNYDRYCESMLASINLAGQVEIPDVYILDMNSE